MEIGNWYIYEIKNLINWKTYIGQRKCPKNKTPETDIGYMGSGFYLKRAFNKYGKESFQKSILVKNIYDKKIIDNLEKDFIGIYREIGKAEYNIADGGQGGNLGSKVNEKIRKVMSSEEMRKRISESLKGTKNPNFGKHLSKDHRDKISRSEKGKIVRHSEEHKQKLSEVLKGRSFSEKHRLNLSKNHWDSSGKNNPCAKKVICIETGEIFDTVREAEKKCNIHNISRCCKKITERAGGFHWEYA